MLYQLSAKELVTDPFGQEREPPQDATKEGRRYEQFGSAAGEAVLQGIV